MFIIKALSEFIKNSLFLVFILDHLPFAKFNVLRQKETIVPIIPILRLERFDFFFCQCGQCRVKIQVF